MSQTYVPTYTWNLHTCRQLNSAIRHTYVCMYVFVHRHRLAECQRTRESQSVSTLYVHMPKSIGSVGRRSSSSGSPILGPGTGSQAHETKSCMQSLTQHFTQNTCIMRNQIQLFRFSAFPFFLRTAYNTIPLHRAPPWSPLSSPHRKSKVQGMYI